jgi:phage baseplate assembly protein gpV
MPDVVGIIRSIIREELKSHRTTELGVVTKLFPHASDGDKNNYTCNVMLKDTGLELQNVGIATLRIGVAAIPDVNDLVLVQFIGGDINSAVVTGRVYNDENRPPVASEHEYVYVSPHDKDSSVRRVYLEFPNGNIFLLDDDKLEIEIGKNKVVVENSGDISVESSGKLKIEAKGDITVNTKGKLSLDASTDINISATNISIKSKASSSVEAGASTIVKGATVSLKGMTSFSPG